MSVLNIGLRVILGGLAVLPPLPAQAQGNIRAIAVKPGSPQPVVQEARVALVIGNGAYAEAPLKNPANDARAMQAALASCGFQVTLLTDASKRAMENAIRDFGDRIRNGAVGLFYFAGHGIQVRGINYLVPVGANLEREDEVVYQAVEAGQVLDKMDSAKNRLNIMILDACRNNPFSRSWRGGGDKGLAQVNAPTGSFIAFATAPGRSAADGTGANGLYTEALLAQLREPGMDLERVFKKTREKVMVVSQGQQTPWESNSTVGDFYFNPLAKPAGGPGELEIEAAQWAAIQNSRDDKDFDTFLARFPTGPHAVLANVKRKNLRMPSSAADVANAAEPWKLLQRIKLETKDEYAARISTLAPVKVGTAVVSVDNYDVDTRSLLLPIQADSWAASYVHQDQMVLELGRDQVRKLLAAGGGAALTTKFMVREGRLEPGILMVATTLGTFTPVLRGPEPTPGAVAPTAAPGNVATSAQRQDAALTETPAPLLPTLPISGQFQNGFGMVFAPIPAGSFTMGDDSGNADEKPAHPVRISKPFAMQTTHVTVKQWKTFMDSAGFVTEMERAGGMEVLVSNSLTQTKLLPISWRDPGFRQQADHPVICISWNDIQSYLQWLNREDPGRGYRLPTEAEWEYCCRAGTQGPRYGELDQIAWYRRNSGSTTHPVGKKEPNAWGLYDMLGNASQWCQDWYGRDYYATRPMADPQGPATGSLRVARGGRWDVSASGARSAYRTWGDREYCLQDMGFRVATSLP